VSIRLPGQYDKLPIIAGWSAMSDDPHTTEPSEDGLAVTSMPAQITEAGLVSTASVGLTGQHVAGRDLTINQLKQPETAPSTAQYQLPPDISDFVGRDSAILQIRESFEHKHRSSAAPVVVAISGKGGIGKTALAIHAAHQLRSIYPDGQLFVDLRGMEIERLQAAEVLAEFLRALGVASSSIPSSMEARQRLYRTLLADRRVLIVLDNAADESQVRPLLPAGSECGVLVTSRSRLAALGASYYLTLEVLPSELAIDLLGKVAGSDRVPNELEAAKDIVRYCGGLPLAVRIAGAKLVAKPHWPVRRLAQRLEREHERLSELKVGDLEVRASFAISYHGQDQEARRCFHLLGLLTGADFAAWVAAALLDIEPDDASDLVEQLSDAELLEVVGEDGTKQTRYRFHDLLRDFARERLQEHEPPEVRQKALERVLGGYLHLADMADTALEPGIRSIIPRTEGKWRPKDPHLLEMVLQYPGDWFDAERANLVAAVESAYRAELWDLTWQLAGMFPAFFGALVHWNDWQHTHDLALDATHRSGDYRGRAFILRSLGRLYRYESRWEDALNCFTACLEAFQKLGDRRYEGVTCRNLGDLNRDLGHYDEAIRYYETGLQILREVGDQQWEAATLHSLGEAYRGQGRHEEAVECFEQCLAFFGKTGHLWWMGLTNVGLGDVYGDQGRYQDAIVYLERGLEIFMELGDRRWTATTLFSLGNAYHGQGQSDMAVEYFEQSLSIFRDVNDRRWQAKTLHHLGIALNRNGRFSLAQSAWREALELYQELGVPEATQVEVLLHD
jgi:tetratricopeptide (TPR) repeat protein